MFANIRAATKELYDTIDGNDVDNCAPKMNFPTLLDVIDGAGSVDLEKESAKTLMGLDEQTETSAIDRCITKLKLQNAMQDTFAATAEANQGCLQQVTDLATWKALVTPFVNVSGHAASC